MGGVGSGRLENSSYSFLGSGLTLEDFAEAADCSISKICKYVKILKPYSHKKLKKRVLFI